MCRVVFASFQSINGQFVSFPGTWTVGQAKHCTWECTWTHGRATGRQVGSGRSPRVFGGFFRVFGRVDPGRATGRVGFSNFKFWRARVGFGFRYRQTRRVRVSKKPTRCSPDLHQVSESSLKSSMRYTPPNMAPTGHFAHPKNYPVLAIPVQALQPL